MSISPRRRRVVPILGILVVAIVALYFLWSWDWFLPIVDAKASAAFGRKVAAQHLHVALGRDTRVELDGISIVEPDGFPETHDFADIKSLVVHVRPLDYIGGKGLVIPAITVDGVDAVVRALADGKTNYDFAFMHPAKGGSSGSSPHLGVLSIQNTHVDVAMAKLRARFGLDIHTTDKPDDPNAARIVVDARGTYAAQPIDGHAVGGALLTLRDQVHPYPLDLSVANGPTHVALDGTIADPLHFAGANLKLVFAGPDMALLYPLTGVPIPSTPPYRIAGQLDYAKGRIDFRDFTGTLGSSDLEGDISVDPATRPPNLKATLASREINLADLGGFIGGSPSHPSENKTAHRAPAAAGGANVLPTTPINLPKLKAMNVDLRYHGAHIEGRSVPLDNLDTWIVIEDGTIRIHKLNFGLGRGTLASSATLAPDGSGLRAEAEVDVRQVDLSHLLNATHAFHGRGIIGGHAALRGTGSSVASLVGHGSGGVSIYMRDGGNISALLPDLAGLEFGNALLSALGVPDRTDIQCFVASLPLRDGVLDTQLFVMQTGEARTTGIGSIDLQRDLIDYSLTTRSTGFSVGSLPGPIHITGPLTKPSILPGTEIVARGAATVGLGIVFAPLALLPTVQLGVGKSEACEAALRNASGPPADAAGNAGAPAARPAPHLAPAQIRNVWKHRLHPR